MTIVISGTSRGIGKFLAEQLSKDNTVIGLARSPRAIDDANANYTHIQADVTDEKQVLAAFGEIRRSFGKIDALVNNAGIASMNHLCLTPLEAAKNVMNVNFFGTFLLTREASKLLRKSENPRIVNFSTVAVPLNLAGEAVYASSKAAIESFTKISAKELSRWKITVNAVGPVPVKTALIAGVPEDKIENLLEMQTIKRFGQPSDVLNVVEFFLKPESSFVTGQVLYLGGVAR